MNRTLRIASAVALGIGLVGFASSASAAEVDGCTDTGDGYVAEGVCELEVTADAICVGDAAYLGYTVRPVGTTATTTTVTWHNPAGADVTLTDQPLSGQLAWPDSSWARDGVDVTFAVNPDTTVTVAYPGAESGCVVQAGEVLATTQEASGVLASTGFPGGPMVGMAGGLLVAGAALLAVGRARRTRQTD